ncbi:hypothetical protein PVAND_013350 [Polypedilum vanderplanki]|uniref:CUB domain-containing protein n=1 Tax=Polypedilum vanderplanki TaxID=319348 RepID=A0A9J6CR51_POLVA|nr:hypothetical protein PVAND_013350 [Polypedilum vanderplanki]
MWNNQIVKILISIVLIEHTILCEEDDVKVNKNNNNSTVTHIQYENNGNFMSSPKANVVTHRIAAYDQQMIGQCGGIYRNIQNLIESPKFISAHPICSLRCEYQIISPYVCENEFHVQFLEFSIDSSVGCERDRVIINYEDEMCGKVVGIKKYRTKGGVLNITFSATSWDSTEKGFRLLVTRLPCVDDIDANQTEIDSFEVPMTTTTEENFYKVNSSYTIESPNYENQHPIYGVPYGFNLTDIELGNRQDIPPVTLPPFIPTLPPFVPTQRPILPPPPPLLPQCCRNIYNQQRFLMLSQGFPAYNVRNNDCVYVIHKSSPNACRLRIHFKYFLLDDIQQQQQQQVPGQLGCFNNFIEIDGQRICGCKTNFVYETQWGLEPKFIRFHTTSGSYFNAQGFMFDVVNEDCPFKLETEEHSRVKRTLLTTLLLKKHFLSSHLLSPKPIPIIPHHNFPLHPLQHRQPEENFDINGDDAFHAN